MIIFGAAPDRRTIGELLANSDALARETLLDATLENAPAMVRSWNQLVGRVADLVADRYVGQAVTASMTCSPVLVRSAGPGAA
jgi:hypothetical protein